MSASEAELWRTLLGDCTPQTLVPLLATPWLLNMLGDDYLMRVRMRLALRAPSPSGPDPP
jgi:hypothetical protein